MGTPPQTDRYHALDALRAAMMLAVVVLHAAMLYTDEPVGRSVFHFSDADGGPEFLGLALLLQAVSMPAFFLTAGFFVAMLVARRGPRAMLAHRLRRITLPFLAFWPVLYGLTLAGLLFGCTVASEIVVMEADDPCAILRHIGTATAAGTPMLDALEYRWPRPDDELVLLGTKDGSPTGPRVWALRGPATDVGPAAWAAVRFVPFGCGALTHPSNHHLIHLWFLWVLTLLCVAAAVLAPLAARLPTRLVNLPVDHFAYPLCAALPLAGVFAWHQLPGIPPPAKLNVPLATVFGYSLFFAAGAILWRQRDRLPVVGRRWPVHLLLGLTTWGAAWALTPVAEWGNEFASPVQWWARVGACGCAAVGHWQLVWACLGVFSRYTSGEVGWVRYLSEASYWVYLVHLPVVLWVASALLQWDASRLVKFPLVLGLGLGIPLVSYHLFVRRTRIGRFLNGPRPEPISGTSDRVLSGKLAKLPILPGHSGRIH